MEAIQSIQSYGSSHLALLIESFQPEYQPLLLCVVERRSARRLANWAELCEEGEQQTLLAACVDQKLKVARRIEALYADAKAIEHDMDMDLAELYEWEAREQAMPIKFAMLAQMEDTEVCVRLLQRLVSEESCEQARQTLSSGAALLQKTVERLQQVHLLLPDGVEAGVD